MWPPKICEECDQPMVVLQLWMHCKNPRCSKYMVDIKVPLR